MKIRDDQAERDASPQVRPLDGRKSAIVAKANHQKVSRDTDRITLSPRAREFRAACKRLAESPDMRPEKIAEIKARLKSGRYRVEADRIAARMIRDALASDE